MLRSPAPPHPHLPSSTAAQEAAAQEWGDADRRRREGAYPFTHLQLQQEKEEEIWIDPLKLPQDISR